MLNSVADSIVQAINASQFGLIAENIGGGRVTIGGPGANVVAINLANSVFTQLGFVGLPTPAALVVPLDATPEEVAIAYEAAFNEFQSLDIETEQIGDRVIIRPVAQQALVQLSGASVIEDRISDEVNNRAEGGLVTAEIVIFIGGGFDYGDAPSPYASTAAQGGPRHTIDTTFALSPTPSDRPVTPDADAQLPDADEDNGVRLIGALQPGFAANFEISVLNLNADGTNNTGRPFYVDAWFDWNDNGLFEVSESMRFGSAGTGRSLPALAPT